MAKSGKRPADRDAPPAKRAKKPDSAVKESRDPERKKSRREVREKLEQKMKKEKKASSASGSEAEASSGGSGNEDATDQDQERQQLESVALAFGLRLAFSFSFLRNGILPVRVLFAL